MFSPNLANSRYRGPPAPPGTSSGPSGAGIGVSGATTTGLRAVITGLPEPHGQVEVPQARQQVLESSVLEIPGTMLGQNGFNPTSRELQSLFTDGFFVDLLGHKGLKEAE